MSKFYKTPERVYLNGREKFDDHSYINVNEISRFNKGFNHHDYPMDKPHFTESDITSLYIYVEAGCVSEYKFINSAACAKAHDKLIAFMDNKSSDSFLIFDDQVVETIKNPVTKENE